MMVTTKAETTVTALQGGSAIFRGRRGVGVGADAAAILAMRKQGALPQLWRSTWQASSQAATVAASLDFNN